MRSALLLGCCVSAVLSAHPSRASDAEPVAASPRQELKAPEPRRPSLLPSLYAAAIALEGFDTASTLHILDRGGVEVNPFTRGLVDQPVAFIAVKASVTAASIVMTERLWKRDHRVAAVTLMLVSNALMSFVAAQNTTVVLQLR